MTAGDDMDYEGRERRRTGPINRIRRALYTLLLLTHAPYAIATDEVAYYGKMKAQPVQQKTWTRAETQLFFDPVAAGALDLAADGELVPARLIYDFSNHSTSEQDRLLLKVVTDDLRMIKNGVGIDLAIPQLGHFHLNLYSRKDPKGPQKRWRLSFSEGDDGDEEPEPATWSLGASVEEARLPGRTHRLMLAPQLVVDLDRLAGLGENARAVVAYSTWRAPHELSTDERVLQATFRWRF